MRGGVVRDKGAKGRRKGLCHMGERWYNIVNQCKTPPDTLLAELGGVSRVGTRLGVDERMV